MNHSEQLDQYATALSAAQAAMDNAIRNRENPHFKSKYADLAAIRDVSIPHLSAHGLSISQIPETIDGNYTLLTYLLHKSGQWMRSHYPLLLAPDKPQVMASALTYARRNAWAAIIGLATEDDDGNLASGKPLLTETQVAELFALCSEVPNFDVDTFNKGVSERLGYEIAHLGEIRRGDMNRVRTWLMARRGKKEKKA